MVGLARLKIRGSRVQVYSRIMAVVEYFAIFRKVATRDRATRMTARANLSSPYLQLEYFVVEKLTEIGGGGVPQGLPVKQIVLHG